MKPDEWHSRLSRLRQIAPINFGIRVELQPVVPPNPNRLNPWEYDRELCKKRNEVERLFRRLKAFRRIFSRFEKLDLMFIAFIHIALIFDGLVYLNRP